MLNAISQTDLVTLRHEADLAARRLLRRLRLPRHELADLCQDLLADLFTRLSAFDPGRGSIGAFAGRVMANRSTRIAKSIVRHRRMFAPISLDDPKPDTGGTTISDTVAEGDGYLAMMGQPSEEIARLERRLDLERAFGNLRQSDRALCASLVDRNPTELSQGGLVSRATLYRQVQEIRLRLLAGGISVAS